MLAPFVACRYASPPMTTQAGCHFAHYYSDEYVTIYHGNSAEIIPALGQYDLLLTDPPYGIKADESPVRGVFRYERTAWDRSRPAREHIKSALDACDEAIIWGGNYFADMLPPTMGWIVWDKMVRNFSLSDGELAWTSYQKALRIHGISRGKALTDGKEHPTQKSLDLMRWCIDYADRAGGKPIQTILDPFGGSGTTARAAKDMNRKCVLIEQNEQYCEIAARRMEQGVLAL